VTYLTQSNSTNPDNFTSISFQNVLNTWLKSQKLYITAILNEMIQDIKIIKKPDQINLELKIN
jgi:hypothetical protein